MPSKDQSNEAIEPHPLLTIDEAAGLLRIGRSRAYGMAHEYLDPDGATGMPVIVLGPGCFRVPRWALLELVTTGRVIRLRDGAVAPATRRRR